MKAELQTMITKEKWKLDELKNLEKFDDKTTLKLTKTDTINKQKMRRGFRLNKLH